MTDPVQVKICGLTNLEDAAAAVEAGADYLGFIFYPPSKRGITPENAQKVTAALRQRANCPTLVGVFVNETAAFMNQIMGDCHLDLAQLSGEEVPFLVNDPASLIYGRTYKALKPQSLAEAEADAEWYIAEHPAVRPTLLLDTYHPSLKGGTGDLIDWAIGQHIVTMTDGLMLAGGLKPNNVADAVRAVRPLAVDVASGVEAHPGKKDHDALRAFVKNAKEIINGQ